LAPISPSGGNFTELPAATMWQDLGGTLPSGCNTTCATGVDNATAIWWSFTGLGPGGSETFSWNTQVVDTVPMGGLSFSGPAGSTVGGTVATITDPNTNATASAYSATINWGDGSSSQGTITGSNGSFNVTGSHPYAAAGNFPIA